MIDMDVFRFVFILVPSFLLAGLAASTGVEYARAYLLDRKIAKATGGKTYGLLPRHVSTISLSYLCLLGYVVGDVVSRLGESGRKPFLLLALIGVYVGLYALYTMIKFQRKRHTDATP